MKVALAIHLFMLSLAGGLVWHTGESPFLLAASMVVVLVYLLLSIRQEPLTGATKLISGALLMGVCVLLFGTSQKVLWPCLLALPQLLSAMHCIWEIQHAGKVKEVESTRIRRSIFTLGFYATLGLAFLMLHSTPFNLEPPTGRMLAVVSSMMGFIAWEASRAGRLKHGETTPLTGNGFVVRIALMGLGTVMFVFLFAVALPFVSDALCDFSNKLKSPQDPPDPKPLEKLASQSGDSDGAQSGEESDSNAGPELVNRTGQVRLPNRGKLELSDEVRVVLKFEDPAQVEALTKQGPLYVRTLAVSKFEGNQWESDSPSGFWRKDSSDGRLDGRVDVGSTPSPGDIAHEVFLLESNGQALPALAGVTTYALPEILVLPDDWFQNAATGNIRYKAWSRPLDILSLSKSNSEPGRPGPAYLTKLDTAFGTRLTETAEMITTGRKDLSGRLELLRQFFQTNFIYSTTVENKSSKPPLENFLFVDKKGYCDFFASAAALILRHMDIPSRVAFGYKAGEHDAATDTWIFRELHAHSWTEVFVKDQGWVICDFTPSSSDSPSVAGSAPSFDAAAFKDAGALGPGGENKLWNKAESLQTLRSPWLSVIVALGLLGVILGFLLQHRKPGQSAARKAARKRARSEQQPAYFLEFLRMCRSLGHPRLEGQTLMEFHRDLKKARFCNEDFDDLTDYYYRSRYEDAPLDESIERRFLKRIRQFRKAKVSET